MLEPNLHRRVLLASAEPARSGIRQLFQSDILCDWEVIEAESSERSQFLMQLDSCDVLLLDHSLPRHGGGSDVPCLLSRSLTPVLLLADSNPETTAFALRQGVHYWLPRELALHHVPVLAAMLRRAAEFGDVQRRGRETSAALAESRCQVNRLVNLLWESVPSSGTMRWFTQRYMLARLEEEVIRAQRYGGSLSVVLGEMEAQPAPSLWSTSIEAAERENGVDRQTTTRLADRIGRAKRRCDVAGQYGLHGFMLILPQTGESGAKSCCRRLRDDVAKPTKLFHPLDSCSIRLGIASLSPEVRSVKRLLSLAEQRLEQDWPDPNLRSDRKAAVGIADPLRSRLSS